MSKPIETADPKASVESLLDRALARDASDIHLDPQAQAYHIRLRIDGVLSEVERIEPGVARSMVARLMVMAQLLTYRLDIPQEGRLRVGVHDLRVSVMPTTHGLRAVVRLPAELTQPRQLEALGLPEAVAAGLMRFAAGDGGMLLLTGPAGAGKTTTIYALLEYITRTQPGVSVLSLEDPVERDLAGVTQIEITPHGPMSYERALRSMLRQDPQVLMIGEIRDSETASAAIGAALSGHRLIATLHAGSPAAAIARLMEMQLKPYQITSALFGVIAQRLVRRRDGAGYRGRVPIAEFAAMDEPLRRAVLEGHDAATMSAMLAERPGYQTLRAAAAAAIEAGLTDRDEVQRVLG
ncbi:MAG: type II/IV secretion system protein [Planctomycetes bacterium]|nr:type II/IV secretion system protein [Planctomycetota bacterium]